MECLVLTVAISQTWDLMISWSDNYLLLIFDVLVKKTELKLDIKFYDQPLIVVNILIGCHSVSKLLER